MHYCIREKDGKKTYSFFKHPNDLEQFLYVSYSSPNSIYEHHKYGWIYQLTKKDGLPYFIDEKGNILLDKGSRFYRPHPHFLFTGGKEKFIYSYDDEKVFDQPVNDLVRYGKHYVFSHLTTTNNDEHLPVRNKDRQGIRLLRTGQMQLYGLMDSTGQVLIEPQYHLVKSIYEKWFSVSYTDARQQTIFYDDQLNKIWEAPFGEYQVRRIGDQWFCIGYHFPKADSTRSSKAYLYTMDGQLLLDPGYEYLWPIQVGPQILVSASNKGGQKVLLDLNGKELLDQPFDRIFSNTLDTVNNWVGVLQDNRSYFIDLDTGKKIETSLWLIRDMTPKELTYTSDFLSLSYALDERHILVRNRKNSEVYYLVRDYEEIVAEIPKKDIRFMNTGSFQKMDRSEEERVIVLNYNGRACYYLNGKKIGE